MILRPFPYPGPDAGAAGAFAPLAGRAFAHLFAGGPLAAHGWGGDWSVIVAEPAHTLIVREGRVERDGVVLGAASLHDPFALLSDMRAARRREERPGSDAFGGHGAPGLLTGAAGYLSYEMMRWIEPRLAGLPAARSALPDMALGFYDAALVLHRRAPVAYIAARSLEAADRLAGVLALPQTASSPAPPALIAPAEGQEEAPKEAFVAAVRAAQARILDGSIFQANITRRLTAAFPGARWQAIAAARFAALQEGSASPYGALLQVEEGAILSDSPEKFLEVAPTPDGLRVTAEPVKGTRARAGDPQEDARRRAALLADEKDRAENVMIADLVRNDLSRVCRDGSIREDAVCELQSFASVHHLVSRISGMLGDGVGAAEALVAAFPCGSVTGAPKIRAMEVIRDLEGEGRGVYCGAIGWFDDGGGAMVSVPIRTATLEDGYLEAGEGGERREAARLRYGTGGGITILSDPQAEYIETVDKAAPFRRLAGVRQDDLERGGERAP